jgi:hypothetical protein
MLLVNVFVVYIGVDIKCYAVVITSQYEGALALPEACRDSGILDLFPTCEFRNVVVEKCNTMSDTG